MCILCHNHLPGIYSGQCLLIGSAFELPEIGLNPSFLPEPGRSRQPLESSENTIAAIECWYWGRTVGNRGDMMPLLVP
ncbi:hypothetical protein HanXRQr2_Chr04g0190891 [Helianthus annuus]|uniref:Uncharacterized protein n=1 Tax=Helianthus annuus TaxID=4232 RepID=A0A9K3NUY3_HELAN|nr:hypothetical protein HanXRQr2_Chr04g0190891 [Helianthus annuus]